LRFRHDGGVALTNNYGIRNMHEAEAAPFAFASLQDGKWPIHGIDWQFPVNPEYRLKPI
jgi:hypothetical protein